MEVFWWRIFKFNWFGHQVRFDIDPNFVADPLVTGGVLLLLIFFSSL